MSNPPIVLLHGWGLSGSRFSQVKQRLEDYGYTVYAPDLPGFASREAADTVKTLADYADFLRSYFHTNAIHDPVLVGHSFGGRVALKFIEMYKNSIRVLVLTGTPGYRSQKSIKRFIFTALSKAGKPLFLLPGLRRIQERVASLVYTVAGARDYSRAKGSLRQTFKNVVETDLVPAMKSVAVPTLLLWGGQDVLVPTSIAKKMQAVLSNSRLQVIEDATHSLPYDKPELFSQLVHEFIQKKDNHA